jgi:hypothetical protein
MTAVTAIAPPAAASPNTVSTEARAHAYTTFDGLRGIAR